MKIIRNFDEEITIYLNKMLEYDIDFSNTYELELYFKELFLKLKKYYNISIKGYYNISVYIDSNYGVILDMKKLESEYLDFYDDQIDMKIQIFEDSEFLYEYEDIFDIPKNILSYINIYLYRNKTYIKINRRIDDIILNNIIEKSKDIIYEYTDCIIKNKNLIDTQTIVCYY